MDTEPFQPPLERARKMLSEGMSIRPRSSSFGSNDKPFPTRETHAAKAATGSLFAVNRRSHLILREYPSCAAGHRARLPEEAEPRVPRLNSSNLLHMCCSALILSLPEPMPKLLKHPLSIVRDLMFAWKIWNGCDSCWLKLIIWNPPAWDIREGCFFLQRVFCANVRLNEYTTQDAAVNSEQTAKRS